MGITSVLWLFFIVGSISLSSSVVSANQQYLGSISLSSSVVSANQQYLDVAQPTTLQISPRLPVEKSPGSKHGAIVLRERVLIHGLSRLKNLRKFAHSVKVNVSIASSSARLPNVEVCFHRTVYLCSSKKHIEEITSFHANSNNLLIYRNLVTRRFFVLNVEITSTMGSPVDGHFNPHSSSWGFNSDNTSPSPEVVSYISELAIFLSVFLVLAGAWLGFCVVRKLVLTEDGLIDIGVSKFVAWSIWIIASVMILQSSADPLLAAEALLCGVVVRRITRSRFIRHLYKNLLRTIKHGHRYQIPGSSPSKDSYDEYVHNIWKPNNCGFLKPRSRHFTKAPSNSPIQGLIRTPPSQLSDSETHYSSFHKTPERKKFSKDVWEKFTKDSTKKALEELVSSPDFSKWAVINAERITLSPKKDTPDLPCKWITWFLSI
ncbi:hypothetical protein TEA_018680 [Camellia sinensis var. sinensis]|uniref:Uncharacterized protein n=1 Tax=Camellia sinensis var. sinensis TaxID=542762 RepID=A0A4S4EG82_CAMSN|nr:hypothetical protein TEA_018680 [Camellia sinensis var. sinensis]